MNLLRLLPVFALVSAAAVAQPVPSAVPASSGPFPTPPAPTQPASPAKRALAREVINAMKADRMFDNIATQMKRMSLQMLGLPSTATPEQRQKAEELQVKIAELAAESSHSLIAQLDEIYAEVYSEAELNAMKAFFTSPEGQTMIAKQPQIASHVMPMVQAMQFQLLPRMQKLVEEAKGAPAPLPTASPMPSPASPGSGPQSMPPTPSSSPGPQPMPPAPTPK